MRLIDADEIKETIRRTKLVKWQKAIIWALIDMHKTVDAVPVRHGRWIECHDDSDWIVCSECGKPFNIIDNCTEEFKYCPNCGARMVEDE